MTILFLGPLVPPEGGFSIVTTKVYEQIFCDENFFLVNRSKRYSLFGVLYYLRKLCRLPFHFLLLRHQNHFTYVALSGGLGQVVDFFFLFVAYLFNSKVFIHHHSFAYIYNKSFLLSLVYKMFPLARDIVLCEEMGDKLLTLYRPNLSFNPSKYIQIVSNSAWLDFTVLNESPKSYQSHELVLGFLSSPLKQKGLNDAVKLSLAASNRFSHCKLLIAGTSTETVLSYLQQENLDSSCCDLLGVLKNSDIADFFSRIDILLLPTNYINEVEPLVILESLKFGVPVLANNRGCIKCLLPSGFGFLNDNPSFFVEHSLAFLDRYIEDSIFRAEVSRCCKDHFWSLRQNALDAVSTWKADLRNYC